MQNVQLDRHNEAAVEFTFRFYVSGEDSAHMAAIAQTCYEEAGLDWIITAQDIQRRNDLRDHFEPTRDIILVENSSRPIAFASAYWHCELQGDVILRHDVEVLPDWRKHGIAGALMEWAESHLSEISIEAGGGNRRFSSSVTTAEQSRIALLENRGYRPARYFFEMIRSLNEPIPEHPLPEGLQVRPAQPDQYRKILAASDEAFQDHWGHVPLTENMIKEWMDGPEFQPHLWQVAWDQDQVAGMILNYIRIDENERYSRKRGYTEDISVRRPWRRRGLATALLSRSLKLLKSQGMLEAGLGVDTENPSGALQLYERLGFMRTQTMVNYRKLAP